MLDSAEIDNFAGSSISTAAAASENTFDCGHLDDNDIQTHGSTGR